MAIVLTVSVGLIVFFVIRTFATGSQTPGTGRLETMDVPVYFSGHTFVVNNPTDLTWRDIELALNRVGGETPGYRFKVSMLGPRQSVTIPDAAFVDGDGMSFGSTSRQPETLFISMQLSNGHVGTSLIQFHFAKGRG
jgi:hypothetical protein